MRPGYDMNNYLLSKRDAETAEHIPLQTTARHTRATRVPFRNKGNWWMLNLLREWEGGKVSRAEFTEKYQALTAFPG